MQRRTSLRFAHDHPHRTGGGFVANNSVVTVPATVHVTVNAADSDGTITQVQYYDGIPPNANLLTTVTTAPFATDLLAQVAGTYSIAAVATDNSGAQTISSF